HVDRSIGDPEDFIATNVVGTYRLLECARRYWLSLETEEQDRFRFLHTSTDEVYGTLNADDSACDENSVFRPNNPYAASQAAPDLSVRAWRSPYELPVITTSCSNNYGPYQFPEKLIPLIIHNALAGKELSIHGDGQQIRDWLHVADHCAALRCVLAFG